MLQLFIFRAPFCSGRLWQIRSYWFIITGLSYPVVLFFFFSFFLYPSHRQLRHWTNKYSFHNNKAGKQERKGRGQKTTGNWNNTNVRHVCSQRYQQKVNQKKQNNKQIFVYWLFGLLVKHQGQDQAQAHLFDHKNLHQLRQRLLLLQNLKIPWPWLKKLKKKEM